MTPPELLANSPTPGTATPETTLGGPVVSAVAVSITTAAPAQAPLQALGQFRVVIDSEIMLVIGGSSTTTWIVVRGVEGSTAATHLANASVYHVWTAGALNARYAQVGTDGTVGGPGGSPLAMSVVSSLSTRITAAGTVSSPIELLDATAGTFTRTLPTGVGFTGQYRQRSVSTNANIVLVAAAAGQTIEGAANVQLGSQSSGAPYQAVTLVYDSNASTWRIIESTPNGSSIVTTSMLSAGGFGSAAGNGLSPVYAPSAASTVGTANRGWSAQLDVPWPRIVTGILYVVGGTSSGSVHVGLYDASGNRLASSTTPVAQPGASNSQKVAFSAPVTLAAGTYFIGISFSSSTATYQGANFCLAPVSYAVDGMYPWPATIVVPAFAAVPAFVTIPLMVLY